MISAMKYLLAPCLLLILSTCSPSPPMGTLKEKDLIVVSIDTLRADRLPFYGAKRNTAGTKEEKWSLNWIAENGTIFEHVWAPASMTRPSFASFWSGQHTLEHGTLGNHQLVTAPLYSEQLSEKGYKGTAGVANWVLRPGSGLERGFTELKVFVNRKEPRLAQFILQKVAGSIHSNEKQLIWAHYMAPHQPYEPAEKFTQTFMNTAGIKGDKQTLAELHRNPSSFNEEQIRQLRALYDGEILTTNEYVTYLLSRLENIYQTAGRGTLLENAIVIIVSDHGEELADHESYFMHSKSLYQGVTKVPLIILGEGWNAERNQVDISLHEILPMIIEGVSPSDDFFVATWHNKFFVARDSRYTLIHNPSQNTRGPSEPPGDVNFSYPAVALFDRETDPKELKDISNQYPKITKQMLDKLHGWHQQQKSVISEQEQLNAEDAAKLEALGYASATEDEEDNFAPWTAEQWEPNL